jgi:sulfur carrier protein
MNAQPTVAVRVNGAEEALPAGSTLAEVVARIARTERGVAVARNGEVVPRSAWHTVVVQSGDVLEVVTATAGG